MRRLFSDRTNYLPEACDISNEIRIVINSILRRYPDVDARDLELVTKNATDDACLEMILDRKD